MISVSSFRMNIICSSWSRFSQARQCLAISSQNHHCCFGFSSFPTSSATAAAAAKAAAAEHLYLLEAICKLFSHHICSIPNIDWCAVHLSVYWCRLVSHGQLGRCRSGPGPPAKGNNAGKVTNGINGTNGAEGRGKRRMMRRRKRRKKMKKKTRLVFLDFEISWSIKSVRYLQSNYIAFHKKQAVFLLFSQ